jgi:uncharacterized protein (DUF433 family)
MSRSTPRPDPRNLPAYQIAEAAHYVSVPPSTVRWWVVGRDHYEAIIEPASRKPVLLSFLNLVELHVLAAIRRRHKVPLPQVRNAIQFLADRFGTAHPLLDHQLQTDGLDLFVEYYGRLVNVSRDGQVAMRSVLAAALSRVERDADGIPVKLYPFTRSCIDDAPSLVVIDPRVSGGRPVISGTGLATEVIAERYKAGETIEDLALDYDRPETEIQEALRCEIQAAA